MPQPHLSGSAALALLIGPGTEFNWERGQGGRDDIEHTEKHDVVQLLHRQGEHPRGAEGEALETYSEELQFSSVAQSLSRVGLCDPMNRSMPGLPVHHQLPDFTQTHVHRVSDAI